MKTTKQILLDIANRLDESVSTSWSSGDLSQWVDHAKRMKSSIASVTPILKTIANGKEVESTTTPTKSCKKEQKVIMTDKQFVINELIDKGWTVVSVTPPNTDKEFCFVLERE